MTLAEFLLARIAEDERSAHAFTDAEARDQQAAARQALSLTRPAFDYLLRWQPARVLAECAAKRRIVQYILEADAASTAVDNIELGYGVARDLLRLLALPYTDHPEHREEWKP